MSDAIVPWYHFLHSWSAWGDPQVIQFDRLPKLGEESLVIPQWSDGVIHCERTIQRRLCVVCAAQQVRSVGYG